MAMEELSIPSGSIPSWQKKLRFLSFRKLTIHKALEIPKTYKIHKPSHKDFKAANSWWELGRELQGYSFSELTIPHTGLSHDAAAFESPILLQAATHL